VLVVISDERDERDEYGCVEKLMILRYDLWKGFMVAQIVAGSLGFATSKYDDLVLEE